jgi:hypothetical protein
MTSFRVEWGLELELSRTNFDIFDLSSASTVTTRKIRSSILGVTNRNSKLDRDSSIVTKGEKGCGG